MAKDVDLSSKEWTDIVFEGKNKEYGAYVMRKNSDRRHNMSMLYVAIGVAAILIAALVIGIIRDNRAKEAQEALEAYMLQNEQAEMAAMEEEQIEEEEIEEIPEPVQEQEPEALPEEILNTIKNTQIDIVADEEVTEQIVSQEELQETTTAIGANTFDQGTDDLNVVREYKDEVIVEEKTPVDDNKVFDAVEQMPAFPGGDAELMKYLSKNLTYPTLAAENGIQGTVVVQFVVLKDGSIGEAKILRSRDPDLDKEAVRVVKGLPKFIPGRMNGQAVNVWFTLPVRFKLQN
ncbi:MAG: energy transducer TonB [Ruminococcus flavefaciens]|nr:energy transducer TonB [Ruminococcus flavefaciens]